MGQCQCPPQHPFMQLSVKTAPPRQRPRYNCFFAPPKHWKNDIIRPLRPSTCRGRPVVSLEDPAPLHRYTLRHRCVVSVILLSDRAAAYFTSLELKTPTARTIHLAVQSAFNQSFAEGVDTGSIRVEDVWHRSVVCREYGNGIEPVGFYTAYVHVDYIPRM
jgi:hypothetical protein